MSNLQPNWCLKIDFQKVDQHAGGKWLIYDTKHRKDIQLQSLCDYGPANIASFAIFIHHREFGLGPQIHNTNYPELIYLHTRSDM